MADLVSAAELPLVLDLLELAPEQMLGLDLMDLELAKGPE